MNSHKLSVLLLISLTCLGVTYVTPVSPGTPVPSEQHCIGKCLTKQGATEGQGCGNAIMGSWNAFHFIRPDVSYAEVGRCKVTVHSTSTQTITMSTSQYWEIFKQIEDHCAQKVETPPKHQDPSRYVTGNVNIWKGSIDNKPFQVWLDEPAH